MRVLWGGFVEDMVDCAVLSTSGGGSRKLSMVIVAETRLIMVLGCTFIQNFRFRV